MKRTKNKGREAGEGRQEKEIKGDGGRKVGERGNKVLKKKEEELEKKKEEKRRKR